MGRHQSTVVTDTDGFIYDLYDGACEKISATPLWGWAVIVSVLYYFGFFALVVNVFCAARQKVLDYANSWKTDPAVKEVTPTAKQTKSPKIKKFMLVAEDGKALHASNLPAPSEQQQ
jgi:hypothetical protein